jgi:RNA polymerase-binding transcription factor DksA
VAKRTVAREKPAERGTRSKPAAKTAASKTSGKGSANVSASRAVTRKSASKVTARKPAAGDAPTRSTATTAAKKPAAGKAARQPAARNARKQPVAIDPLAQKAEEVERLREYVEKTSFSGDEQEVSGELSAFDQHPADISDVTEQRSRDYAIKQILEQEADQIQEAMQRKSDGRYGICESCGRPISKERLKARPEAVFCIDCQRAREAG